MADTTNFSWTKPTVGGDSGAWGSILNTAIDDIDTDLNTTKTTADAALPKAGGTMTGRIDVKNEAFTAVNLGSSLTGTVTLNCASGNFFYGTMSGNITIAFSNVPSNVFFLALELKGAGAQGASFPASVKWDANTAPTTTPASNETDLYWFYTRDAGTTWRGALALDGTIT